MQLEWVRDEVFLNIFAPGARGRGAHPLVLSRHKSEAPVGPKVQALFINDFGKPWGRKGEDMSGFLVPALPEHQLAPQSRTFEGPVKIAVGQCSVKKEMEERPLEM